jgi:hypothetical protein
MRCNILDTLLFLDYRTRDTPSLSASSRRTTINVTAEIMRYHQIRLLPHSAIMTINTQKSAARTTSKSKLMPIEHIKQMKKGYTSVPLCSPYLCPKQIARASFLRLQKQRPYPPFPTPSTAIADTPVRPSVTQRDTQGYMM